MYIFKELPAASTFKWHHNLKTQQRDTQDVTCQAHVRLLLALFFPRY